MATRTRRAAELLARLVAIDTTNPMGRTPSRRAPVERDAIIAIEELLAPHADCVSLLRQPCSPQHESLIIRWPVASSRRPALFESHVDTVPGDAWADRAWRPRKVGDRLVGLGACDDKGSLTAMLLALVELLEQGVEPPRPIVLMAAGDEEYAQTGINRFLEEYPDPLAYGVFGEPTGLVPIVQHKGIVRWDITVHGRSAHTSRPELGLNAIVGMTEVIAELRAHEQTLQDRARSTLLTGPTITVTQIQGGRTRNATPDECTIAVDFRVTPGMNPTAERDAVIERLSSLPWSVSHSPVQLMSERPLNRILARGLR
ncbi:MAG TPA: M20/M25/M40 family metallo-hydrolase [Lacipirellulaceae bacterium]|nr:M20/M25/M40 family metallo-hydrolase [Lacipirellulaceae bacterium]